MFQYMLALRLADLVTDLEVVGYEMPEWDLVSRPVGDPPRNAPWINQHLVPLRTVGNQLARGRISTVVSYALGFRLDMVGPPSGYRSVFRSPADLEVPVFGDDHLVVNIRAEELFKQPHPDYRPVPLSFIVQVVKDSGLEPVFVGQLADDRYSDAIRGHFPGAAIVPSRGAVADFEILRRAAHVAIPVSTFAWLATWLSHATNIYVPVSGMYHPRRRPDIDLLPSDDQRYVFYDCGNDAWAGTSADIDSLFAPSEHEVFSREQVAALRAGALSSVATQLDESRRAFRRMCRRARMRHALGRLRPGGEGS